MNPFVYGAAACLNIIFVLFIDITWIRKKKMRHGVLNCFVYFRCDVGYYGDPYREGCEACNCNVKGSRDISCDPTTGQCQCYPGITGRTCSECRQKFYAVVDGVCQCESFMRFSAISNSTVLRPLPVAYLFSTLSSRLLVAACVVWVTSTLCAVGICNTLQLHCASYSLPRLVHKISTFFSF